MNMLYQTLKEISHPVMIRKLFRISLTSVIGSSDKVGGLPKRGIEKNNKWSVTTSWCYRFVKKCLIPCLPISYSFSSKFALRIKFSGPFSSSWNTIFPCTNRTLFLIFSRIIWRFFLTFCWSCRVLSSRATHTSEALVNLIWLNARLSKGSFCDIVL